MVTKKIKKVTPESRIILWWAIVTFNIGVFILLVQPIFPTYKVIQLDLLGQKITAGWALCVAGLIIQFIDKMPMIIETVKKVKK